MKYAQSGGTPGQYRQLERVIMFRDGVSDGELRKVREEEIASIKRALCGWFLLLGYGLIHAFRFTSPDAKPSEEGRKGSKTSFHCRHKKV